jgi:CHAD domain-containing protein
MAVLMLKFQVPGASLCAVRRAMRTAAAPAQPGAQMKRVCRIVRSGTSRIRITFDEGPLQIGEQPWPVHELAFESLAGPPAGLVTVASRWIDRHALWFGTSARFALAEDDPHARGTVAGTRLFNTEVSSRLGPDEALSEMVGSCLEQLMPHAERVAAGIGSPLHLHQTRVALRRLRTALRVFGSWGSTLDPRWDGVLRDVFRRLGAARDSDAIAAALAPELAAAGAPPVDLPGRAQRESPAQVLQGRAFNRVLTELIVFAGSAPVGPRHSHKPPHPPAHGRSLKRRASALLNRLHRQVMRDTPGFLAADDATRHRTRKRLKRLRYSVEFVAPLFKDKAVARYLKPLCKALDALGALNDLNVADPLYRAQLPADARAWFAVGWIAARRASCLQEGSTALNAFGRARRFWES